MRSAPILCLFILPYAAPGDAILIQPGESIQAAIDRANPGDVVHLAPGTHRERVSIDAGGEYGAPVVLEGEDGAIIDGSEPVALEWTPADDVAPGVWRAPLDFEPFTVTADGKIITILRESRVSPEDPDDPWHWRGLLREGTPDHAWKGVEALAMYRQESRELLVRFGDNRDPRQVDMTVAPRESIVWISGADRCVVRNLELRNGAYGVLIEDSLGSVVEGCKIGPVDYGVWLGPGSDRCTVRFNELFMDPYAGADPWAEGSWDNWLAHKQGGHYDRYGVQIRNTVGGHEVHDNHIHDTWDGIEDVGAEGENVGLRIHHNLITTISDDGLEPNGAEEDCRWHNNLVEGCICGFRIKSPRVGPLYAYRNLFLHNKEDFRNYGEVELKPAVVYVYHNTSTAGVAIQSNKVHGIGTPNYHYFNNLFWCAYWWGNAGDSVEPNWHGDHNVYVRRGEHGRWDAMLELASRLGFEAHGLFTSGDPGFADAENGELGLRADSPAIGRGGNHAELAGVDLPGAVEGETPDCGALQLGEPMPVLPRPRNAVDAPEAGTWPGPDAVRFDPWSGPNLLTNGSFEEGLAGWEGATEGPHSLREGGKDGDQYLEMARAGGSVDLRRTLADLEPGAEYVLVYYSRNSNFGDYRVILRNLDHAHYLTQGAASVSPRWRRTALPFTAPEADLSLELSPRTDGSCDIDGIALHERAKGR